MRARLALLFILLVPCWVISSRFNVDLKVLHTVAQWIGVDWNRIYGDNGASGRFFYGPVSVLFLLPLKALSYSAAFWLYGAVQTVSYGILWWVLYRSNPRLWMEKRAFFAWTLLFIFSINPIHNNFQSGNVQLQLIGLLLLAEVLSGRKGEGASFTAGMIASVPILVKIFPLLFLPYYAMTKRRSFFFGLLAGAVVLHLGIVALSDVDTLGLLYKGFVMNLSTYGNENSLTRIPDLLSLPSLFARLGISDATVAVSGLLYSFGLGVIWKYRKTVDPGAGFALIMAIIAVINPSTRVHYFVFYIPLFSYVCNYASYAKRTALWVEVAAVLVLLAFTVEGVVGKSLNNTLEFWSVPTLGVLFLILVACVRFGNVSKRYA